MEQNEHRKAGLLLFLIGIIGSIIFIFIGYLLSGIIGAITDNIDFLTAFCIVMASPFGNYFNELTPITMIVGFILFEIGFFFFLRRKQPEEEKSPILEPDIIDVAAQAGLDSNLQLDNNEIDDKEIFASYLNGNGNNNFQDISDDIEPIQESIEEVEVEFSSEITDPLFEAGFDLKQIKAMLLLKKYIKDLNADLLIKMFDLSISAEEIERRIKLLYE